MDLVRRSEIWRAEHQESKILAGLRIILGIILLYKGIYFISHWQDVAGVISQARFGFGSMTIAHWIALCNLAGGFMIAIGFLTRVAILFQIPIVLGAVLFMNANKSVFHVYSEWLLSLVVLFMLVFFLFYGPGIYSMDVHLRSRKFYE